MTVVTMRAVSLWQPWALLLVAGLKRVETRSWKITPGPLLIHAAKSWPIEAAESARSEPFRAALATLGVEVPAAGWSKRLAGLPFGAIVGRVDVVRCYRTEDVLFDSSGLDVIPAFPVDQVRNGKLRLWPDPERAFGDYGPNRWAWLCENPVRFAKPIPYKGGMRLFNVKPEVFEGVAHAGR